VAIRSRELVPKQESTIILIHNHPGGDPSPSQADVHANDHRYRQTARAVQDHIIVGKNGHASLKGMRLI